MIQKVPGEETSDQEILQVWKPYNKKKLLDRDLSRNEFLRPLQELLLHG